jgi:transcriptional regulator with XRE-family HTH domain
MQAKSNKSNSGGRPSFSREEIIKLREKMNLTQVELATELSLSQSLISAVEAGVRQVSNKFSLRFQELLEKRKVEFKKPQLPHIPQKPAPAEHIAGVPADIDNEYKILYGRYLEARELNEKFMSRIEQVLRHTEDDLLKLVEEGARAGPKQMALKR